MTHYDCAVCKEEGKFCSFCLADERNRRDSVNHPDHYNKGGLEAIDVIEAYKLGFNLGNVVKYILRADEKGKRQEDLRKALWYLKRELGLPDDE